MSVRRETIDVFRSDGDPTTGDLPAAHRVSAIWQNQTTGDTFDWDAVNGWVKRSASASHARQHAIDSVLDHTGFGDSVTKNVGTTAGTVAAGDHTHTHNAVVGTVSIGTTAPSSPQTNDLWIDTN